MREKFVEISKSRDHKTSGSQYGSTIATRKGIFKNIELYRLKVMLTKIILNLSSNDMNLFQ